MSVLVMLNAAYLAYLSDHFYSISFFFFFVLCPVGSTTSWSVVRRGELMFSSASRENNAHWHMKTSDPAGHKCAARGRQKTTSRTWGPIGGERLKRDVYSVNFLTTKRWAGAVLRLAVWGMGEPRCLVFLHVVSALFFLYCVVGVSVRMLSG